MLKSNDLHASQAAAGKPDEVSQQTADTVQESDACAREAEEESPRASASGEGDSSQDAHPKAAKSSGRNLQKGIPYEQIAMPDPANAPAVLNRCIEHANRAISAGRITRPPRSGRPGGRSISSVEKMRQIVEHHFKHMDAEAELCEELRADFAWHRSTPEVCVQHGPGNPTENTVIAMDDMCSEVFGWVSVVKETFHEYSTHIIGKILEQRFRKHRGPRAIQQALHISSSTYYQMLDTGMRFAELLAVEKRLLSVPRMSD